MKRYKKELEIKLKEKLGRNPEKHEVDNSVTDVNLIVEILKDEIETLKTQVAILEKRKNMV